MDMIDKIKSDMIISFRIANEIFEKLKTQKIDYGDKDHTISMMAREIFRALQKEG